MKKIYKVKVNGKVYEVELEEVKAVDGKVVTESKPIQTAPASAVPLSSNGETVDAPMPGVIVDIKVKVGDTVKEGDLVAVLEAMKMETEIFSTKSGVVSAINVTKGTQVELGDVIVTL